VVKFALYGSKTRLDISETFSIRELSERHTKVLIHAGKGFDFVMSPIVIDELPKVVLGEEIHDLRKDGLACIQPHSPSTRLWNYEAWTKRISNRLRSRKHLFS